MKNRSWRKLACFLLLTVGGGLLIGWLTLPGAWYASLNKPSFNPPNWIFGPVWTVLYVMIALAGWRVWHAGIGGWPLRLWWAQLVLNFLWSPTFFGIHAIGLALVVILLMLAAIILFIARAWTCDRTAALLFVPYALWVSFATALNFAIYRLN